MNKMNPDVEKIQHNISSTNSNLPTQTDIVNAMKKVIADRVALSKLMPETELVKVASPRLNPSNIE